MNELCTYLLKFSTERFTDPLSESDSTHYLSLLHEADVNVICDTYGNTPLHLAWMSGHASLIIPLLTEGALYVRNNIKCFQNELGLFPQQMAVIVDRPWRVAILDPEGSQYIQDSIDFESTKNIPFRDNFTASTQEDIEPYQVFFARHNANTFYENGCKLSCSIVQKMMSGEIDCNWLIDNI
ncbi:MAG: ankyrin repeat domain-containing protein [Rickettsiales bacterium]|nr:ankyrin repeat domain-containing protein [Rickettsiales bacterium]